MVDGAWWMAHHWEFGIEMTGLRGRIVSINHRSDSLRRCPAQLPS
jgi:hypothetical protein